MRPTALRIERWLTDIEARLVPPPRKWLRVIVHEGDEDEPKAEPKALAEAKEKALAEHIVAHPEDAGRTVEDFNWIECLILSPSRCPGETRFGKWGAVRDGLTRPDSK